MLTVLGIDVDDDLLARWRAWFAPGYQLFRLAGLSEAAREAAREVNVETLPLEVRDTFGAWRADWGWIADEALGALPPAVRDELLETRVGEGEEGMFVTAAELADGGDGPLIAFVEDGETPSLHAHVSEARWAAVAELLPNARRLAGTFPPESGPNCFGNVLTAAGVDVEGTWLEQPEFEAFLAERAVADDDAPLDEPGTVLVWRLPDGLAFHACVTLGDGLALNKPSQGWWGPRYVWSVARVLEAHADPELTLGRYRLRRG